MKRPLTVALAAGVVLLGLAGLIYAFGTPQSAEAPASAAETIGASVPRVDETSGSAQSTPSDGDPSARGKEAPPADPNTPLAIEIPGCTCHSDDPKLVEEHASYRMNQCAGCHVGGTPTGQE